MSESNSPVPMSLVEYTTVIGNAIRMTRLLQGAWVMAELSDVRYSGGHCYMELIEKNPAGQTVAKLRANIWASRVNYIRQKFFKDTQRDIANGMKVMVFGTAGHHSVYGLSFTINDINPSYTLGDMERIRREILMRLQKEGVIDQNKQEVMSPAPQRIAIISAEGAAGYGDFINQLAGNSDGFVFYPHLFPAVMQGERTSQSVREALDMIEQTMEHWDCVAIIRGGGATTDLNGFDDYDLAYRVATFPLPIVVGIGHERDRTVLDEIAHTRMKTPTAVAAFFIDKLRTAYSTVGQMVQWITRYSTDRLVGEARRLDNVETTIPALANARLTAAKARLDRELTRIPVLVESRLAGERGKIDSLGRFISMAADGVVKRSSARLDNLTGMIEVLSPANTLRRGYSITRVNGHAVTDASTVKPGDILETQLNSGTILSKVTPTQK
ncbi:MAG: exodeoxyribonuclease VII large subunit [Muribaculaceae bacterium]|nr:exodeoxyribonuclease VII large subunit [Muribaculaceae bacterium]